MQWRQAVDELVSRRPLPAGELSRLDVALRPTLVWGALHHPDPPARRLCLDYLDHLAGRGVAETITAALDDPVPRVRRHAIHALTCQACKPAGWHVDAVTPLRVIVARDPSPKVRFEALRALLAHLDAAGRAGAMQAVIDADDRPLLSEVVRARRRAVPADLRTRAERVIGAATAA
jgi:HEAT repeat protein